MTHTLTLVSWNVNSLKVRLPQLLDWIDGGAEADVICLQELKQFDATPAAEALAQRGWTLLANGQKTYNGVAIASRAGDPLDGVDRIPGFDDPQRRLLAASVGPLRVVCVYVPNGQSVDSEKYRYKLAWLEAFGHWLAEERQRYPLLAVLGDFNIAPEDRDVHDPKAWAGSVLVSPAERAAFQQLLQLGLVDSFRLFDQPDGAYSWWDYRTRAFARNLGLRIDHILLTRELAGSAQAAGIHRAPRGWERPSDHAPVWVRLAV